MRGAQAGLGFGWAVGGLLALALALRVAVALAGYVETPTGDAPDYIRHGVSIAAGDGFPRSFLDPGGPSALRAPGYPYFIGSVLAVSGESFTAVRLAQALLGVVAVWSLGWVAARLFGRRAGLAALALAALYPPLVLMPGAFMSEALFLPLVAGTIAAALWAAGAPDDHRRLALAGLLAGVAILTRMPGIALLVAVIWIVAGRRPGGVRRAAVVTAVAVLCVAPWTVRNALVVDAFVPVNLDAGIQLAGFANDEARLDPVTPGAWRRPDRAEAFRNLFGRGLSEPEIEHRMLSGSLSYLADHPGYMLRAWGMHALTMLHLVWTHGEPHAQAGNNVPWRWARFSRWAFYALALAAAAGFVLARPRPPAWLWVTPLLFFVPAAIASGLTRYRLPCDPFLIVAAAAVMRRPGVSLAAGRAGAGAARGAPRPGPAATR